MADTIKIGQIPAGTLVLVETCVGLSYFAFEGRFDGVVGTSPYVSVNGLQYRKYEVTSAFIGGRWIDVW